MIRFTRDSGTVRMAYSFISSTTSTPGSPRSCSFKFPEYFTISSQVRFSLSYPTSSCFDRSRIS